MNTNNVMAALPQQGAPSSKGSGKVAGTSGSTSKNSFDDALGKLQADAKENARAGNSDTAGQGREAMTDGGAKDGAPQDPLAAALAASQQNDAVKSQDKPSEVVAEEEAASVSAAAVLDLTASALLQTEELAAQSQTNLQALLPRSENSVNQRQEFHAMMMGEPLPEGRPLETGSTPLQLQLSDLGKPVALEGMGGARNSELRLANQDFQVLVPGAELEKGMPAADGQAVLTGTSQARQEGLHQPESLVQQAAATFGKPGQIIQQAETAQARPQQAVQQAVQQVVPQQAAAVQEPVRSGESPLSDLFGDAQLAVEEQEAAPLRSLHQQEPGGQAFGQGRGQEAPLMDMAEESAVAGKMPEAAQEAEAAPPSSGGFQTNNMAAVPNFHQQVQQASSVAETQAVPQETQPDFDVPRQIVDQARLIRSGEDTEMVIRLKPEHLGELTLRISVTGTGAVNASFHSDNVQVRAIIENSLVQLRQDLNDQGLKVDQVEVFSGLPDGQLPQGQGQQAWQEQRRGMASGNSRRSAEDYADEAEDLTALAAATESGAAADSVDYRI